MGGVATEGWPRRPYRAAKLTSVQSREGKTQELIMNVRALESNRGLTKRPASRWRCSHCVFAAMASGWVECHLCWGHGQHCVHRQF